MGLAEDCGKLQSARGIPSPLSLPLFCGQVKHSRGCPAQWCLVGNVVPATARCFVGRVVPFPVALLRRAVYCGGGGGGSPCRWDSASGGLVGSVVPAASARRGKGGGRSETPHRPCPGSRAACQAATTTRTETRRSTSTPSRRTRSCAAFG